MTAVARHIAPVRPGVQPTRLREVARPNRPFIAEVVGDKTGGQTKVNAIDFVDAVVAFLSTGAVMPTGGKFTISVTDCETGESCCYSLDFTSGEIRQG
jgi:hypothetical protein